MGTTIERYRRTYHSSEETDETLSSLPEWMAIRGRGALGWEFVNALFGNPSEHISQQIGEVGGNVSLSTSNINEPYMIWKTYHDTRDSNIPASSRITAELDYDIDQLIPSGTLLVEAPTVRLVNVYEADDFFNAYPTRLSHNPSGDVMPTGLLGNITGLTFVKDWGKVDASGVIQIPTQDVYIVNQALSSPVSGSVASGNILSTVVYNTSWEVLDSYDYGIGYQTYEDAGKYEVITNPSGVHTFEHNPVESSISVFDYLNLDASGAAQVISSDYYTVSGIVVENELVTTLTLDGINPYNNVDVMQSNYFVTYTYLKFDYPAQLTTPGAKWGIQRHTTYPIFTSVPANYYGTVVRHEVAATPSGNDFALRVDPRELRPGSLADVTFNYIGASDVAWDNTSTFTNNLTNDPNFVNTASGAAHIYHGDREITEWFQPSLIGSSIISIPVEDSLIWSSPFFIRCYYNARVVYSGIVAVQSFSTERTEADPYPADYVIENEYLIPYSILSLSDSGAAIHSALLAASADQFEVVTDLLFTGIAYDKDKNCYWMIEGNNKVLYKMRPSDGGILGKWNIFKPPNFYFNSYKSVASGVVDPINNTSVSYPLISHDLDCGGRSIAGCVYYDDYLYINAFGTGMLAIHTEDGVATEYYHGASGIYPLDTYNDRVMDIEYNTDRMEVHPHFPAPSGIVDLAMIDDNMMIVTSVDTVARVQMHYDYILIDSKDGVERGTVLYRESYPVTTVEGYNDWTGL